MGGKRQLLPQLFEHVPKSYNVYHEPFLGGGALYFALRPKIACLSDLNWRLINAYGCVQQELQETIVALRGHRRSKSRYYEQRNKLNYDGISEADAVEKAARFIYINKSSYNGLWRVNASGDFNVPYGGDKNGPIVDEANLLECSILMRAQSMTSLYHESFENVEERAQQGDLVYFDPPYIPIGANSFTSYTDDGFSAADHVKLRDLARRLKERDVHIILSNSDTPETRDLYAGFKLHEVTARRSVNSDGAGRSGAKELIII